MKDAGKRGRASMRRAVGIIVMMAAICAAGSVTWAQSQTVSPPSGSAAPAQLVQSDSVTFDIPPQSLRSALTAFAEQSGWQLFYSAHVAEGLQTPGFSGSSTPETALQRLLAGTGLDFKMTEPRTVTLIDAPATAVPGIAPPQPEASVEPEKLVKIPEIVVKVARQRREHDATTYVAEETITATRTDTPIRDIPQSIQAVTRQVIEEQRTFRLQDALQNVSGITATDSSAALWDNLIIRGFAVTDRTYFRNGLFDPFAQFIASDTYNIRRLEVLKGPASVLYGQGDPGGIVNIVTFNPLPNAAYRGNVTLGNYNLYRSELDATGSLNAGKTLLYRLNVVGQKAGSFIDFANRDVVGVAPALTWLMGSRTALTVEGDYLRRWSNDPYGLPAEGTFLPNINGPLPRNRSVTLGDFSRMNRTSYRIGYDLTHQFNNDWSIRHAYRHTIMEDDRDNLFAFPIFLEADQRTLQRLQFLQPAVARRHAHSMVTNLVGHLRVLDMDHTLLTGVELRQEKTDQFIFTSADAPPLDLFSPNYSVPPSPFIGDRINSLADNKTAAFYMQDQVAILQNLKAVAGFRFDYVHQSTQFAGSNDSSDSHAVSPRLGLVYQPLEPVSLYTSWTKGFQPSSPGSFNARGQLFDPERSTQYEVGTRVLLLENRVSVNLAWFHLTRTNVLTPDLNNPLFQIASGEQRSQGVELDVTASLAAGWNVIASYAYTDAEVTKDNDPQLLHRRLANVPYNKVTLWSTYHFQDGVLKGFGMGGGLFAYGDRNGSISIDQPAIPGYIRADAALYYNRPLAPDNRLGAKVLSVALNIRNLLDQRYVATSQNGFPSFFFGEPRTVLATVGLQF